MSERIKPTGNTIEVDCGHLELCFHCGKHMAVGVHSQAGFMCKCLNCGAEELETEDSRKVAAVKELIRWNKPEFGNDLIELMKNLKEIVK